MSPPDSAGRTATVAGELTTPWHWLDPWREAGEVEAAWRSLEARFRPPWFLRWAWVENWLACLPPELDLRLAVTGSVTEPEAGCFIGRRRRWRHGLFPVRECHLNATGYPQYDNLWIEYNAVPGRSLTWGELLGALPGAWDEFHLPGLDTASFPGDALSRIPPGLLGVPGKAVPSPRVDLAAVRHREARGGDYLDLLGRNTRSQIRRSWRLAEEAWGPIRLEEAADPGQGELFLERLAAIHQESWQERGEAGVFGEPWFLGFHRRLVERHFDSGVQLLALRAGEQELGYLYNLVADGRVLFYQCGIPRLEDNRIKPGLMAHAAAIRHNAARGEAVYDFLGGDTRYKQSLATTGEKASSSGSADLAWFTLQRPGLTLRAESLARSLKRRLVPSA
jgi:CelD/BcsL family acetyltransferase involved in cellulose biosynthesis